MRIFIKIWVAFLISVLSFGIHAIAQENKRDNFPVYLTWMSNTNWLVEAGDTRILLDGWVTRIPRPGRLDITKPESLSIPAVKPDIEAVKRILDALDIHELDFILSGHSHFDHSFDTAVWARLTGARIVGPRSTCQQARAQGIPESRCTVVEGGEILNLGKGLKVRVVEWHHSGNPDIPLGLLLQTPMELKEVPKPDPITGGLKPGILDDFPHGGIRAYLFTYKGPDGQTTWFFDDSGNARTFEKPAAIDKGFLQKYGITLKNLVVTPQETPVKEILVAAMKAEELAGVDLWLGYNSSKYVERVIKILKPRAFIAHHWGGVWSDFFEGLQRAYSNPLLEELLIEKKIKFLPQQQYMEKYRLDMNGLHRVSNRKVKEKLGLNPRDF